MRATQHFHRGLLLGMTRTKRKEIHRNILKYFWSFWFFFNKQIISKNKKNYLHGKAPNKQKKNKEIFLGFIFSATANYSRKKNKKEAGNIFVFSQSFSNTEEESEKINLTWMIQWKSVDTDN